MSRPFAKYEGLGNDFIVLDAAAWPEASVNADLARRLCDRHRGIGADGVLWVSLAPAAESDARLIIWNADGSRPEMCGNGVRCVVSYFRDAEKLARERPLRIATDAGVRVATARGNATSGEHTVEVDMGLVRVARDPLPLAHAVAIAADVGNPHAVLLDAVSGDGATAVIRAAEARTDVWPRGVNVEFARANADGSISVRVHERGVGWTRACGTGACAVAAVAVARGWGGAIAGKSMAVQLDGGTLEITAQSSGDAFRVAMRGPARRAFVGMVDPAMAPRALA